MTFHLNGEEVRVFHVPPAHTDGDSFVYFTDSDVLHTGDVFRTNMYPIVERWGQVESWTARDLVPIIYNEAGGAPPTVR